MTWYCIRSIYSPVQGEESSQTCCRDIKSLEPWKSTHFPETFYCTGKRRETCPPSLFGMTSEPSQQKILNVPSISNGSKNTVKTSVLPVGSPVKMSPVLEKVQAYKEHEAASGVNLDESLKKCNRLKSSLKTPPTLKAVVCNKSLKNLPSWGIMRAGALYRLPTWGPRISESVSGCMLPTPTVNTSKNCVSESQLKRHSLDLMNYAAIYPTPIAHGLSGGTHAVEQLRRLEHLSDEEKRSLISGNGGILNARWVEWLMGWPIGWTDISGPCALQDWKQQVKDGNLWPVDEHEIPRLAEDEPDRRKRLKVLGNGQVPSTAAEAYKTLKGILRCCQ